MLMIQVRNLTPHTDNRASAEAIARNIRERSCRQLLGLFEQQASVQQGWLFGSRAMGRHHPDRLLLLQAIDQLRNSFSKRGRPFPRSGWSRWLH